MTMKAFNGPREELQSGYRPSSFCLNIDGKPMSLQDFHEFASMLLASNLKPDWIRNEGDVLFMALKAHELRVSITSLMTGAFVIGRTLGFHAHFLKSLANDWRLIAKDGWRTTDIKDENGHIIGYEMWDKRADTGEEYAAQFTLDDAIRAGLWTQRSGQRSNYDKFPANMVRSRCLMDVLRFLFPEVAHGKYCDDEVRAMNEERQRGRRATDPDRHQEQNEEDEDQAPMDPSDNVSEKKTPERREVRSVCRSYALKLAQLEDDEQLNQQQASFSEWAHSHESQLTEDEALLLRDAMNWKRETARAWLFDERCGRYHEQNPDDREGLASRWDELMKLGAMTENDPEFKQLKGWLDQPGNATEE